MTKMRGDRREACYYCERDVLVRRGLVSRHKRILGNPGTWCVGSLNPPHARVVTNRASAAQEPELDSNNDTGFVTGGWAGVGSSSPSTSGYPDLDIWWHELASGDLEKLGPKIRDYSSYDLDLIGQATADMIGFGDTSVGTRVQIACWFYILGKVGRAIGALKEGRLPSDDTVKDTRIYATMIARARDYGGWPGLEPDLLEYDRNQVY